MKHGHHHFGFDGGRNAITRFDLMMSALAMLQQSQVETEPHTPGFLAWREPGQLCEA
jgi:hypothetical protein